jgi:peptidoglycan/LPS O-acetylase OafA/YrhL
VTVNYRAEIDGLRAVAVSTVVLYHAKVPGFASGYLGVDVFFVISGFLITSIIFPHVSQRRFSYSSFLERRVRRILPALSLVMMVCMPFAWYLMLPDPLENFGQSLVATVFSANNILLSLTSGYWDLAADFKPLVHTWSLGVEEQFYLAYPFLLIALTRLSLGRMVAILLSLAVVSFAAQIWGRQEDPDAAFYLIQYRAWELILGALAYFARKHVPSGKSESVATLSLVGVLTSVLAGATGTSGGTVTTVGATLGTAGFLYAAEQRHWAARVLSCRPAVFVGLISYSLYLWHQPILAYLRIASFDEPGEWQYLAAIVLAVCLSWISWKYVVIPFRQPETVSRQRVGWIVGGILGVAAAAGLAAHLSNGFPSRMSGQMTAEAAAGSSIAYNERVRRMLPANFDNAPSDRARILVVGNSFARDFANILLESELADQLYLAYRSDLDLCDTAWSEIESAPLSAADAVVFASGGYPPECIE